jgi:metallo-beta-lactamase family protein
MTFLGATDTVTGSRYLIESDDRRVLVDCGLFQGVKTIRDRNRAPIGVAPESIDAVLLTHAHLDHSGYLPALVRDGFTGPVYCTSGTAELCQILLPDSGYLLEEEAAHARAHGYSVHPHPTPVYTAADALAAISHFRTVDFDTAVSLGGGMDAEFVPAGHILGASQIRLRHDGTSAHFTGDLGRPDDPLMRPPRELEATDILVTESTYGDRKHGTADPEKDLGEVITRVAKRGGVVLIPAFAVGRTETVLLHLSRLRDRGEIPEVPIFLNSPMAINVARVYERHPAEHRLSAADIDRMYSIARPVRTVDESKLLNLRGGPMVIISASGMLTGGRILHHLDAYGSDPRNAIVLTGFQATGTRGAALAAGATTLRVFGRDIPVRAEVLDLMTMSAHADGDELLAWMARTPSAPRVVYVTHGEPSASDTLRARIKRELGWPARVPERGDGIDLSDPR